MSFVLKNIENKINQGQMISFKEAKELAEGEVESEELFSLADKLCKENMGYKVDLCSIINAKSGRCSENCKYCSQSGHYNWLYAVSVDKRA